MTTNAFNLKSALATMKVAADTARSAEQAAFDTRIASYRTIGEAFESIVKYERSADEKVSDNAVFLKHEKAIKAATGLGKTIIVNECLVFARVPASELKATTGAYLKVGIGDQSKDQVGNVRKRTDYLASAVKADLEVKGTKKPSRWNRTKGQLTSASPTTKLTKDAKTKRIEKLEEEMDATEWGGSDWDLSRLTADELKSLIAYAAIALKRAELLAK